MSIRIEEYSGGLITLGGALSLILTGCVAGVAGPEETDVAVTAEELPIAGTCTSVTQAGFLNAFYVPVEVRFARNPPGLAD